MVTGAVFEPNALCGSASKTPEPCPGMPVATDTAAIPITALSNTNTLVTRRRRFTPSLPIHRDAICHILPETHPSALVGSSSIQPADLPRDSYKERAGSDYLRDRPAAPSLRRQVGCHDSQEVVPTNNRIIDGTAKNSSVTP